jgi:hypothetical protein
MPFRSQRALRGGRIRYAVDYVELGRDDDARAEIAEVRKLTLSFP